MTDAATDGQRRAAEPSGEVIAASLRPTSWRARRGGQSNACWTWRGCMPRVQRPLQRIC
jgi:hypothetical protein